MEDMKVSLESLYTNKVKEIDYEGEEHYQERSSLSQHVTELAQRVDFSEVTEGKEGEPAVKKATQKWPWEQPHSKLKQALTEVSVLADMLHILHDHRHYMAMDTVAPRPTPSLPLAFQYIVKKKALARAAEILKRGTEALTHSSSREERAFHRALAELRRRWRVRRAPNGNILGDLGYSTGII
ncbi:Mediator of RNA polymerase II transcription subunit 17 [Geodia barretti]|uniref:Mediator of RNA polymerase II transcription subunit 17 n=1 Tax=Geodia barretti TaxID=519541 RepID=A0AA35T494_GEOBA|nr:Mediator of RNA polymerase II transcription subunit 17 [Geodia barretti]